MTRRIGGVFLRAAHGPLAFAASCLSQNQVLKGLEELAPEGLVGGLERGVTEVARLAGVPTREVQALLPWEELGRTAKRLEVSQAAARATWRVHAGAYGFLDLITQLTVDGRPADIQTCLERLAAKLHADEALAEPLLALARDVGAWEQMIGRCREILDDGEALGRAWRLRRQRRIATIALAVLVMLGALTLIVWTARVRARVAAALESTDACAALAIAPSDRGLASGEQDRAIADAERRCAEARAAQAESAARAAREAEERERAAREAGERAVRCKALAKRLTAGEGDAAFGDAPHERLAQRIAARALEPADLGPVEPSMPCWNDEPVDPDVAGAIDAAYLKAILAMGGAWVASIDPCPRATRLLAKGKAQIADWQLSTLADRARRGAEAGLLGGDAKDIARAVRVCALAEQLDVPGGAPCAAMKNLPSP